MVTVSLLLKYKDMGHQALIIECVWKTPFHKSGQNLRTKIGTGEYGGYSVHWKFQIVSPKLLDEIIF